LDQKAQKKGCQMMNAASKKGTILRFGEKITKD
jgi:hypothetical protein